MTLKQLEAFYLCATSASFAIAAERLHLALSSLSKRIGELEASLGVVLFDRTGQKAVLTEAGERLLPRAVELLELSTTLRREVSAEAELTGRCVFGVGELGAVTWLPAFIARVKAAHPKLQLAPFISVGNVLEERIGRGELDFAVVAGRSSRSSIVSQKITEGRFVWARAPGFEPDRSIAGLLSAGVPLVALPPSAGTTRLIDDWLTAAQVTQVQRLDCNNWWSIAGMLVLSVGVGILPCAIAESYFRRGLLRPAKEAIALTPMAYSFQSRRGDTRPLIASMLAHARTSADLDTPVL